LLLAKEKNGRAKHVIHICEFASSDSWGRRHSVKKVQVKAITNEKNRRVNREKCWNRKDSFPYFCIYG